MFAFLKLLIWLEVKRRWVFLDSIFSDWDQILDDHLDILPKANHGVKPP